MIQVTGDWSLRQRPEKTEPLDADDARAFAQGIEISVNVSPGSLPAAATSKDPAVWTFKEDR